MGGMVVMQYPSYIVLPLHLIDVQGKWQYNRSFRTAEEAALYLEFFGLPVDLHWHPEHKYFIEGDAELNGSKLFDSLARPVHLTAFMTELLAFYLETREPSPYASKILKDKGVLKVFHPPNKE